MNLISARIIYSILFYLLLLVLISISQPQFIFDQDGRMKEFGVGSDKTIFSFGVFGVVLAIVSFFIFCLIDVIFKDRRF